MQPFFLAKFLKKRTTLLYSQSQSEVTIQSVAAQCCSWSQFSPWLLDRSPLIHR